MLNMFVLFMFCFFSIDFTPYISLSAVVLSVSAFVIKYMNTCTVFLRQITRVIGRQATRCSTV